MKIKKWPNKVRRFFSINKKQLKKDGGSTDGPGSELDQQHASKKKQLAWTPDDIFDEFHGTSPIPPEMKGYVLLVEVGGGEVDQGWVLDYSGTSGSGDEVVVARYDLPQSRIKGKKAPSSPPPGMYNTYDLKTLPWIWYKDLKVFNKIETGKLSDMVAFVTGRIAVAGEMKPWEGLDASWKEAKDRVTEKRKLGGGGAGDNDGGEEEEEEEEEAEEEDNADDDDVEEDKEDAEAEAKAIAEATASADKSYVPPTSLLNSPSPYPLIRSVDGMSLKKYNPAPSVFTARSVPVPLRGKLNVPIHVTIGGSVVEYTVESEDYDVGFGVVAEREEGVTVVTPIDRVDAHVQAVSGKFLVGTVPCALIFTFDNEYSWFREKKITYQITVSPPTKENIISGRKLRATKALAVVSEDRASADERLEVVSEKREQLVQDVERLEKELEEKKKSLGVVEKEEGWLQKRVQLRSVQEDLLNRRLANGWEDENEVEGVIDEEESPERAEV
mmetsp:Transcript_19781/g.29609  ORF Transcript_19781/g.29609 Transcript_19781/m.29609 type:complete len:499 (+) Transcript_19781:95-1591(+)